MSANPKDITDEKHSLHTDRDMPTMRAALSIIMKI